ncbi:hypothetical protein [Paenibacillus elgii]|uniref:hypothetical protein n=1 Tax=Paenibacillus elgii TaxID=189691 RepID=UPI000248C869|nr:hypothetical protein [Paenibacillus elgii]
MKFKLSIVATALAAVMALPIAPEGRVSAAAGSGILVNISFQTICCNYNFWEIPDGYEPLGIYTNGVGLLIERNTGKITLRDGTFVEYAAPIPHGFETAGIGKANIKYIINPSTGEVRRYNGVGWTTDRWEPPMPHGFVPASVNKNGSAINIYNPTTGVWMRSQGGDPWIYERTTMPAPNGYEPYDQFNNGAQIFIGYTNPRK